MSQDVIGYRGGVLYDKKIYLTPYTATKIGVYDLSDNIFKYKSPKLLNDYNKGKLDKFNQITGFEKCILIEKEYGPCIYYLHGNYAGTYYMGVYNINDDTFYIWECR